MKPDIEYVYNKLKKLRFDFNSTDFRDFRNEYRYEPTLKRYVRKDDNDLFIAKETFKPLEEELDYAEKCHDLEEQLGCPLDFIFKVLQAPKIYIEGMNVRGEYDDKFKFHSKTNNYIINPYAIAGKKPEFLFVDRWSYGYDLRLKDYKKTWWLKEDKSE